MTCVSRCASLPISCVVLAQWHAMSIMSLSPVALRQSLFIELNSFRGVRHHSAELTCVATRHTFSEQHKVRRLLLQKVVHPNDVVSSKSIFQGAF